MTDEERNELVVSVLPLIKAISFRFTKANGIKDRGEVEGTASYLAVKASRRFDPDKGVPFFAYVDEFLYRHLLTVFMRRFTRKPFPRTVGVNFVFPDKRRMMDPDFRLLDWIPNERDKVILRDRLKGFTFREIGERVGVSETQTGRIIKKHLKRWNEEEKRC